MQQSIYAQQSGASTSGPATSGAATGGNAPCYGTTCIYYYDRSATMVDLLQVVQLQVKPHKMDI